MFAVCPLHFFHNFTDAWYPVHPVSQKLQIPNYLPLSLSQMITPIQLAGASTYLPRLNAIFSLPLTEDGSVVGVYGLKMNSDAHVLSSQFSSSRRACITRHTLSRKSHSKHGPPLVAMRFTCTYSEDDKYSDRHFLLAGYVSAFTDRVPQIGRT
jgi:hypothetical protein